MRWRVTEVRRTTSKISRSKIGTSIAPVPRKSAAASKLSILVSTLAMIVKLLKLGSGTKKPPQGRPSRAADVGFGLLEENSSGPQFQLRLDRACAFDVRRIQRLIDRRDSETLFGFRLQPKLVEH